MTTDPNLTSLTKVRFADPRTIIANAIKAFLPPEQIYVAA